MIFDPRYVGAAFGHNLSEGEYNMRRAEMMDMANRAANAHEEHVKTHENAIRLFSWHSKGLNHTLLFGKPLPGQDPKRIEPIHEGMMKAFTDSPPTHAAMHVYSGISGKHIDDILSQHGVGDTIGTKAYTSTSFNPEVAAKFGAFDTLLHVKINKGQRGILHIERASLHPSEKETVIRPGTKLRINTIHEGMPRKIISTEIMD